MQPTEHPHSSILYNQLQESVLRPSAAMTLHQYLKEAVASCSDSTAGCKATHVLPGLE